MIKFSNISNILDTISKFTVELKVFFFYQNNNNKMVASVDISHKNIILVGESVKNQLKLLICRFKFSKLFTPLHSKEEGFYFLPH